MHMVAFSFSVLIEDRYNLFETKFKFIYFSVMTITWFQVECMPT